MGAAGAIRQIAPRFRFPRTPMFSPFSTMPVPWPIRRDVDEAALFLGGLRIALCAPSCVLALVEASRNGTAHRREQLPPPMQLLPDLRVENRGNTLPAPLISRMQSASNTRRPTGRIAQPPSLPALAFPPSAKCIDAGHHPPNQGTNPETHHAHDHPAPRRQIARERQRE